jgi:WD repeat-containing protein 24
MIWNDSHSLWAQHVSGAFSQLDMRYTSAPTRSVPRCAISWSATGTIAFAADRPSRWETPFDDMYAASVEFFYLQC